MAVHLFSPVILTINYIPSPVSIRGGKEPITPVREVFIYLRVHNLRQFLPGPQRPLDNDADTRHHMRSSRCPNYGKILSSVDG